MTSHICDTCETVAHCSKHGCIPVTPVNADQKIAEATHAIRKPYFAYDPEGNGLELFQTLESAMRSANESLQCHRDDAQYYGEWPEGADRVCVGVITHVAAAKGSESEGVDYEMAPLAAAMQRTSNGGAE